MPLAHLQAPFDLPGWLFEPKLDGFRALAYVENGACSLVSRNHNAFKTFPELAQAVGQELAGRSAILDGEIVRPGKDGHPLFYELMRRRGPFCFYAFDLLWLDGVDLRALPLSERKTRLRKLLPRKPRALIYVQHATTGTDLFQGRSRGGHGGHCGEAGGRQLHARRYDLGQNQEPALLPGSRSA